VGTGVLEGTTLTKPTGVDNWDTLFIFNEPLESGVWEFELKVTVIQGDKSGLVFGFFRGDNRDPS